VFGSVCPVDEPNPELELELELELMNAELRMRT
jgi:hypothetical protein